MIAPSHLVRMVSCQKHIYPSFPYAARRHTQDRAAAGGCAGIGPESPGINVYKT